MEKTAVSHNILTRKVSNPWPFLCALFFLFSCYLYACLQSLDLIAPGKVPFLLDLPTVLELFAVAIGSTYGSYRLYCIRERRAVKIKRHLNYMLVYFSFFAIAFVLEITVFQYQHYSGLENNTVVSSEESTASWKSLKLLQTTMEGGGFTTDFFFSKVGLFSEDDGENREKAERIRQANLRTADNSYDDEYAAEIKEKEELAAAEGIKAAYPLLITYDDNTAVVRFENLDTSISSVYIDPFFLKDGNVLTGKDTDEIKVFVMYSDEDNMIRTTKTFSIVEGLEYTNYIPVHSVGKVSSVSVCFTTEGAAFYRIILNQTIPLSSSFGRILLISVLLFLLYALRSVSVFSVRYDETNKKQNLVSCIIFAAIIGYFALIAHNTIWFDYEEYSAGQYNHYLVDALLEGRVNLDIPTSEEFAALERKYDRSYYALYGIDCLSDKMHWDAVYYEGQWYSYFGIVPAVLLFVPYTLVTGGYLPYSAACWIFGSFAITFLLLIWRRFFSKYLTGKPYCIYVLSSVCLVFCSFIPFLLRRSFFYETVNLGGLMFCAAGLYLLLCYYDRRVKKPLFVLAASCFCFALAVGCSPILVLVSVLVPLFLWKDIGKLWKHDRRRFFCLCCSVAGPYIAVAIPLMWYNFARFGSIFEFGISYQVTALNIGAQNLLSTAGQLQKFLTGIVGYFFNPPALSVSFPFVTIQKVQTPDATYITQYLGAVGIFCMPVMWLCAALFGRGSCQENDLMIRHFILVSFILSAVTAGLSAKYCIQPRYEIDYAWLMVLSALACIYLIYERCGNEIRLIRIADGAISVILVMSILFFWFLCFRGELSDQATGGALRVFHYMKRVFTLYEGI